MLQLYSIMSVIDKYKTFTLLNEETILKNKQQLKTILYLFYLAPYLVLGVNHIYIMYLYKFTKINFKKINKDWRFF